jgi:outer membrane autotransporter protein
VLAATDPSVKETSAFVGLERFENKGRISLQDDAVGDVFEIANTPGGTDLDFVASGKSELAVDAFLGGPGSTADNFIIDGNVSGKTKVDVNNTNAGPGVLNKEGIPVVYVNGATPKGNEFFLSQPIDTGFFDYDLFFRPTGSGVFELRSFIGQGAFVLPQLETAAQDLWADGAETWFDRTADLRVLLNGSAPLAPQITPAVWVRAAGSSLDRDASAETSAFGNSYRFNLDRNLEAFNFEGGIDFGKRDLLSPGDLLVFGLLGGGVASTLDYDNIDRTFDLSGGEAGAYATYLKGGLLPCSRPISSPSIPSTRRASRAASAPTPSACVPTRATVLAASAAAPSSSRSPPSP